MAPAAHAGDGGVVEGVLEGDLVGHELVVEAGGGDGVYGGEVAVEEVPEDLGGGADDAGAACGADDGGEVAVGGLGDDGGDGGEGPLAGAHVVGGAGGVAEFVVEAGDGEVVHLVVEHDARLGNHEEAAEEQVHRCGRGDGHPVAVSRGYVRSAVSRGNVYALWVVILHGLRGVVADPVADRGEVRGIQHGSLEGCGGGHEGGVPEGLVGAVGEAHGFVEAM